MDKIQSVPLGSKQKRWMIWNRIESQQEFGRYYQNYSLGFIEYLSINNSPKLMIREYDYLFKIVIVGNSSVGKSALLQRFTDDKFTESHLTTIGVDFKFKTITVDGNIVKLQIWDTAGQEQFRTITSTYYKGAHGILMVYDITNQKSYDDVQNFWMKEIENYAEQDVRLALIGNKSDCENKQIKAQDRQKFADSKRILSYEVSAKTGNEVDRLFVELSKQLMEIHPKADQMTQGNAMIQNTRDKMNKLRIQTGSQNVAKDKKCC